MKIRKVKKLKKRLLRKTKELILPLQIQLFKEEAKQRNTFYKRLKTLINEPNINNKNI